MDRSDTPQVVIIAGPNGAGKTTLAPRLLMQEFGVLTFLNADIVALARSPADSARAAVAAGRTIARWLRQLREVRASFAFETTLSGLSLRQQIGELRQAGYDIHLIYFWLPSADVAVERVRGRARMGGHSVPEDDICRRYERGLRNFMSVYRMMVSRWLVYNAVMPLNEAGLPPPIAVGIRETVTGMFDPDAWRHMEGYDR